MKLGQKFIIFALVCSIIPLVGMATFAFEAASSSLGEIVETNLESIAEQELEDIQNYVRDARGHLVNWSNLGVMQDVLRDDQKGYLQTELEGLAQQYPIFADLLIVNSTGLVVASTNTIIDKDNLRKHTKFYIPPPGIEHQGPVRHSFRLRKNIVTISIPIQGIYKSAAPIGSLVGLLDWQKVEENLAKHEILGGEQDQHRFVVLTSTATNNNVLYSTNGRELPDDFLSSIYSNVGVLKQTIDESNYVVASTRSTSASDLHDPQWALHVALSEDLAYSSIHNLLKYIFIIVVAAIILTSIFGSLLARVAVKPINELVISAKGLASGNYDLELPHYKYRDEIGELTHSFRAMRDAIKINQQELIERTEISEEAAKLKGEFLANMSHEVRTPINGVLGMTELLLNTELDKTQSRYATTISRSGQSLLAVINDILDFSKIEAGKLELQDSAFDLRELVDDVVELVAESAHRKGVEISAHLPPSAHVAYQGDPSRLRQILINLLGNAVKFTSEGEVKLAVTSQDNETNSSLLRFEVSDTGIGIPPEAQAAIFESFVQADGTTTRKYGGSGLGLAISAQLTELMQGEIGVNSVLGDGSTFWFTAQLGKLSASVEDAWQDSDSLRGRRILIVDDNKTNREILQGQVQHWGANYALAEGAQEALCTMRAAVKENKPFDLAILDMHMPGMDGLALTVAIKADNSLAKTRLVLLSSVCDELDGESYRAIGLESVLTKPTRQPELFQCLTAVLTNTKIEEKTSAKIQKLEFSKLAGRVLIAEDNLVNQDLISEIMKLMSLDFHLVGNGQEAIDAFSSNQFDAVLMDCQMPVMGGFEATGKIREIEKIKNTSNPIPIIALTANALQGDRERCLESGMDEYISKPVSSKKLHEILSQWLSVQNDVNTITDIAINDTAANDASSNDASPVVVAISSIGSSTQKIEENPTDSVEPPLDPDAFAEIMAISSQASAGFLDRLTKKFVDNSSIDIEKLEAKLQEQNTEEVRQLAHSLKSSSANLGAKYLAGLCQMIESAAGSDNLEGMEKLMDSIQLERNRVIDALGIECRRAA